MENSCRQRFVIEFGYVWWSAESIHVWFRLKDLGPIARSHSMVQSN